VIVRAFRRFTTFASLHNLALEEVNAHAGNGPWDDDLQAIETLYLANRGDFLVGVVEGEVVAMGALRCSGPRRGEIKRMRVDPRMQGRGYGKAVLACLEARALELGYDQLPLDTTTGQIVGQALYRANGYRGTGRGRHNDFELVFFAKSLH
jgi:GNAT superfamily N-acetyltransferase